MSEDYTPRLKARCHDEIRGKMQEEFSYESVVQISGVTKVVTSVGVGAVTQDKKQINGVINGLALITDRKPKTRRARKSVTNFKLHEGDAIGARVILRGDRMWGFLDRLLTVALSRICDFRGLSDQQPDGHGSYTFGLSEQTMFYGIDVDKIGHSRGMNITVMTAATSNEEGRTLLRELGLPLKK